MGRLVAATMHVILDHVILREPKDQIFQVAQTCRLLACVRFLVAGASRPWRTRIQSSRPGRPCHEAWLVQIAAIRNPLENGLILDLSSYRMR